MTALSVAGLLDFERTHPGRGGVKDEAIRAEFGVGPARYYLALATVAGTVEALEHDPITARLVRERFDRARRMRASLLGLR